MSPPSLAAMSAFVLGMVAKLPKPINRSCITEKRMNFSEFFTLSYLIDPPHGNNRVKGVHTLDMVLYELSKARPLPI
jgi:hypothetical protein